MFEAKNNVDCTMWYFPLLRGKATAGFLKLLSRPYRKTPLHD